MKFAIAEVDCCHRCPNYIAGGWCSELERETEGAFRAPPTWCPLPDAEPVRTAVIAERARVLGIIEEVLAEGDVIVTEEWVRETLGERIAEPAS